MFYEQTIQPHHAGFGQYQQSGELGEGWTMDSDLLQEIASNIESEVFELGHDDLPAGMEDIRGLIQGGIRAVSERVFGYLAEDGSATYFAIVETEESDED